MNENLENNEFFQQLPEETKEKIRNCKSEEEAMELLKSEMIPIPDDALDEVSGGVCWTHCLSKTCPQQAEIKKRWQKKEE